MKRTKFTKTLETAFKKKPSKNPSKNYKTVPERVRTVPKSIAKKNPQHQKCKYFMNINYLSANDVSEDIYKHPISIYQFQILNFYF
jgi:hypothetical protein